MYVRRKRHMRNLKLRIGYCTIVAAVCHFAAFPALATDYQNPAAVKQLIEQIIRQPQPQPQSNALYYSCCVSHFDGFIPTSYSLDTSYDKTNHHYRFTFQDGRVTKCEYVEESGKVSGTFVVWNNNAGAPVLTAACQENGDCSWYMYAEYDPSGKIHAIYRFNSSFELQYNQEFSYEGSATRIKEVRANSNSVTETLYENGEVFLIANGQKRKVNKGTREQSIRAPVKFGLKPLYPGY